MCLWLNLEFYLIPRFPKDSQGYLRLPKATQGSSRFLKVNQPRILMVPHGSTWFLKVPLGYPKLPKVPQVYPRFQGITRACMQFHGLACSATLLPSHGCCNTQWHYLVIIVPNVDQIYALTLQPFSESVRPLRKFSISPLLCAPVHFVLNLSLTET